MLAYIAIAPPSLSQLPEVWRVFGDRHREEVPAM
jgi:hypothetical protein